MSKLSEKAPEYQLSAIAGNGDDLPNNVVFRAVTLQSQQIHKLIVFLKEMITDVNLHITKNSIKISNMDKSHTIFIDVELYASEFNKYYCEPEKIIIATKIEDLYHVTTNLKNEEILTLYIERKYYHDGIVQNLTVQTENGKTNILFKTEIRLIEPDTEELYVPDVNYTSIIYFPTSEFQSIVRYLSTIGENVMITSVGNELKFESTGTQLNSVITCNEAKKNMQYKKRPEDDIVICNTFSLKSLSHFTTKCTSLCPTMELYFDNDMPIIACYQCGTLGPVKLSLAPF
jgi:proliferating cell nuclear antigen